MAENPTPPGIGKAFATVITIAGTCIGILVGGLTMYYTLKDRVTAEIEGKLRTEIRLTRIEEQLKSINADLWVKKTSPASGQ